ncbi:hypothetical protein [Chryseobacterium sp. Leaf405]|uniref:hypothetical protein n=1 Tax=Chryseobacterium sp. Leaf405 TaxID=1736367 RepID=UPI000A811F43|nr:hypothetical protein [Chryseobacterium sp. Leaf405]
MVSYFIGGSLGTWTASMAWQYAQWSGVCFVGATMAIFALIAHLIFSNRIKLD